MAASKPSMPQNEKLAHFGAPHLGLLTGAHSVKVPPWGGSCSLNRPGRWCAWGTERACLRLARRLCREDRFQVAAAEVGQLHPVLRFSAAGC
jgi:hypothetical protein